MNDSPHSTAAKEKRTGKGKRRFTAKKAKSSALDELVETSRIIGKCMQEPPRIQISSSLFTIPEAISELESMSEVMDESQFDFYDYSTLLLKDKQNRETFMSIRKDRRLRWLQARTFPVAPPLRDQKLIFGFSFSRHPTLRLLGHFTNPPPRATTPTGGLLPSYRRIGILLSRPRSRPRLSRQRSRSRASSLADGPSFSSLADEAPTPTLADSAWYSFLLPFLCH
ncbi:hypothetical protein KSP40_PGU018977 [Platanthera guangdongensis]|uniref:Uncharacterized protein n=1 Tax=Platanthera guangdongensis TaxID=2320717 RepID=A0ABR2LZ04_9ASPA